jgi:hypothetical protein
MPDAIDNLVQDLNQSNTVDEFPGYPGYKLGDLVPGMGGVRIGDLFYGYDQYGQEAPYGWRTGVFEFAAPPTTPANPDSQFENYIAGVKDLQDPVSRPASPPNQPYIPTFTPMAAPPAVRVTPPTTPANPDSEFENYLDEIKDSQAPVSRPSKPYTPTFTPMVAPPAVRVPQPPVDPMSYYSDPEIIPESPLVGDPDLNVTNTLTPRKPSKSTLVGDSVESVLPDISNVGGGGFRLKRMELSDPMVSADQEQLNPESYQLSASTSATTVMDPDTGLEIEVIPNPDFVEPRVLPNPPRLGLPEIPLGMIDPVMDYDQWKWVDRYIKKPDQPTTPVEDENVKNLTEEEVKDLVGNQIPTPPVPPQPDLPIYPEYNVVRDVITTNRPNVPIPKPYQFKEYPTTTYTGTTKREGRIIPFKMPTEVPIPPRRDTELLAPGRFQDIDYDPNEILAAAMRVLRGRGAGRSLME